MQHYLITAYNRDRAIAAVKAVRFITGLGLKEAKAVVDAVRDGTPQVVSTTCGRDRAQAALEEGMVTWYPIPNLPRQEPTVREALRRMPQLLTVVEILMVLDAAAGE